MRRIKASRRTDESFDAFLARRPGGESLAAERRLAARFVRGFHAADTALVSTQALAESGSPGEDEREQRLARFVDGYDKVAEWLAAPVHPHLRLSHIVTRVRWSKGEVEVESSHPDGTRRVDIRARAAVIAVPLGVSRPRPRQTGAIEFDPGLTQKSRALQHLAMGPVVRMVFRFRERFWSGGSFSARGRRLDLDSMSFLHTSDRDFPVWWTANPFQSPLLVAWCGGPDARRLAQIDRRALELRAISRLSAHLGMPIRRLTALVEETWFHDWLHDPFARGAYSYPLVGGTDAPADLAKPLRGTLFFAGEATDGAAAREPCTERSAAAVAQRDR